MLSILEQEPVAAAAAPSSQPVAEERAESQNQAPEAEEFEIVVGKRQLASILFVATVMLAVFSSISYLAGKSETAGKAAPQAVLPPIRVVIPPPPPPVFQTTAAAPQPAPKTGDEPPLFSEPNHGAMYLQLGAVEKGIAVIMAEGLRKRGFSAFVAPGPSERIFRVLIGPFANTDAYRAAKQAVDEIGLTTFARKYEN
jgi:cell division septation protein DedD